MKIKIGVMGSATEAASPEIAEVARALGEAIAARDLILLTGATTGVVHLVGKTARDAGAFHIGISPAENEREHVEVLGHAPRVTSASARVSFPDPHPSSRMVSPGSR